MKKFLSMLLCVGWLLVLLASCASEPTANPSLRIGANGKSIC